LKKELNLKSRRDYIETDYTNGVYNEDGSVAMRKLTEEEKDWLNMFYMEVVNADRRHEHFYNTDEDWKQIYHENNARNRCLYNKSNMTGNLTHLTKKHQDREIAEDHLDKYDEIRTFAFPRKKT